MVNSDTDAYWQMGAEDHSMSCANVGAPGFSALTKLETVKPTRGHWSRLADYRKAIAVVAQS